MTNFPKTTPSQRRREFNQRTPLERAQAIYHWLFLETSHREIDASVYNLDPKSTRGFISMGVLHALGLKKPHRGYFKGYTVSSAIELLKNLDIDAQEIIGYLQLLNDEHSIKTENAHEVNNISVYDEINKEETPLEVNISTTNITFINKNNVATEKYYLDGELHSRLHTLTESDPGNRQITIDYHGPLCKACGFDFEKTYGDHGKSFIEIHHIEPVFQLGKPKTIDPITDLVPLCSNCHSMIHRQRKQPLSLKELKSIINKNLL